MNENEEAQISSLNNLLQKIVNEPSYSLTLISSNEYEDILRNTSSNSPKIKPLSLLILTKLFENAQKNKDSMELFKQNSSKFIIKWLNSTKKQEKLYGYSALESIFQISNDIGSFILLKEGILEDIMDCIEFEPEDVQIAITEIISVACSQKDCRALVGIHCQKYLTSLMSSKNQKLKTLAAVALTKILLDEKSSGDQQNNNKISVIDENETLLAGLFQNMVLDNDSETTARITAIEGLAYSSLKPAVKETIVYHPTLLKEIFKLVQDSEKTNNSLFYGVAVILANVTTYKKKLSQSEEQLLKLKKMSGESVKTDLDPIDDDEYVINRTKQIMKSGVIRPLIIMSKNSSQAIRQLVAKIFLNLATDQSNRGAIVQQGGIKALIPLSTKNTKEVTEFASQALAKIAITMDPNLAFRGERSADLVRPFLSLCQGESELGQFEALMALTNLGSTDNDIRLRIYDAKGIPIIENLQFSDNTMIRRAATECLCNMIFCEPVYNMYSDPKTSSNRIKILVALSDVEDFETRRAASGALAILSTSPDVCNMIVDRPRGIEILKDLISEESVEMQHRSVECFKNISKVSKEMSQRLVEAKVHENLTSLIKNCKTEPVVATAVEALQEIAKYGYLAKNDVK
ncbi:armadillo-type protein [Gigaspora rosea]|uniref:Armadillo-type protein n=1 Tax=Gigaspora rosea TaxID=44941 RepID=A0A397US13_9GLOM|nr:armadillo-type protein [Gigaspora rosea]CAG8669909.1 10074_t:CDS:1 [Gigaspora rosea]